MFKFLGYVFSVILLIAAGVVLAKTGLFDKLIEIVKVWLGLAVDKLASLM